MKKSVMLAGSFFAMIATQAFAEEAVAMATTHSDKSYMAIASAIAIAIAVLGGTLGQGKAASAALEGMARNPAAAKQLFVPMLLSLALIESLVLLAFVIAFLKINF